MMGNSFNREKVGTLYSMEILEFGVKCAQLPCDKTRVHDLVARDNCVSAIHNNKYEDYSVQYPHGGLHLKSDMNWLVIWAPVASTFHLEKQRGNEAGKYTETTAATTTDQHSWVLSSSSRGMLSNYKSDYAAELQQRRN